jgi:AraC family transcriptional regulator
MTSIKLHRGEFGYVSMLNVASDLVTHAHAEAHLIIWLDGTAGTMHVDGIAIEPGPNVAIGINSFQPHSHSFEAGAVPGSFLAFYIRPEWASERFGLAASAPLFHRSAIALDTGLRAICLSFFDNLADETGAGDLAAYEIERLVESVIDAAGAPLPSMRVPAPGRLDYRVRKAVELMRANVSGRISFDELARCVGLSRPHFFALFKEQMNLTPNVFWNALRMEEALRQLQGTEEPLTAVACNLGFTTQGNFTRFFRDHAGVPPTLYREAARTAA